MPSSTASATGSAAPHRPAHSFQVVIIGAGLGGLCLAQGLSRAGIDVVVYERDDSARLREQGYRISLKSTGAHALRDCLPPHLFDLCVATSLRPATTMTFTDAQLQPKFSKPLPPTPPGLGGLGVNRLTLREILLAGLGERVHFGRTFDHYEQTDHSRIAVCFTDGTAVLADLLVGADGTHSAVRTQLVPDAVLDELHWSIYGRTPITADTARWLPDPLVDSFNRVLGDGKVAFSVATCRPHAPYDAATRRLATTVSLTPVPDYLQWITQQVSGRLQDSDPATVHRAATKVLHGWHPAVRRIVAEADVGATFAVRVTAARPVSPWSAPNVTLLGDAVHTMPPGRGDGASTALRDAQVLLHALQRAANGEVSLVSAKRAYEMDMLDYGFAAVAQSLDHPFGPTPTRTSAP